MSSEILPPVRPPRSALALALALPFAASCSSSAGYHPIPQAADLTLTVSAAPEPWIVRAGATFKVRLDVTSKDGAAVPEADVSLTEQSSTRSSKGVIHPVFTVAKARVGVSSFELTLTARSVPVGHTTSLLGVLSTAEIGNPVNASAVSFELPNLVIYGGDAARVDLPTAVTRMIVGEARPMAALVSAIAEPGFAAMVHADEAPSWTSSDPAVVTVSSAGLLRAAAPGTATLTATAREQRASLKVVVAPGTLGPPPDGLTPMTERVAGTKPFFLWPSPVGQDDVLVDTSASDDSMIRKVATDARGWPFVVSGANGRTGQTVYDDDQILLGEWTGSGMGFSWIGEPWESAQYPRVIVDERDQLYVVYVSNVAGLRIAQRDAKRPDAPFTYRTASWLPTKSEVADVRRSRLDAPYNFPYGIAVAPKPGGGIYVGSVFLGDASTVGASGCLELVQLFAVSDAAIERAEVRQQGWAFGGGVERHCGAVAVGAPGGGTAIQLLRPLAGEAWPRFLYAPADRDGEGLLRGVLEFKPSGGAWSSAPIAVAAGAGDDPLGPVTPVTMAMLAQTTEPGDPEIASMLGPNLKTGHPITRMVRRRADGSWQEMMGPNDALACRGDGALDQMCGGVCQYSAPLDQTSCFGSTFNQADAPLMSEGNHTQAIGVVNGRLLFTAGRQDALAYVVDRTGATRRDVFSDRLGRKPEDVPTQPLERTLWHFAEGRVLWADVETSGDPTALSVLGATTQPRATPRYADAIADGQRLGDDAIADAIEAQPQVDDAGRLWVHGTQYDRRYGAVFRSEPAQHRFERLATGPAAAFSRPTSILSAAGKTLVADAGAFWMTGDGGASFTKALTTGDSFLATSQVLLPGGQYFGVEVHQPSTFVRRYGADLLRGLPLVAIADPEWDGGSYLRAGDDAAVLLANGNQVHLLSVQKHSIKLPGPNTFLVIETFASDGVRTARLPVEWTEPREPALTTAVLVDATHVGLFVYPKTGAREATFVRVDLTTGARVTQRIAAGDAWPRRIVKLTGGQLAAGWTEWLADGRRQATVAFSTDGGASWGAPRAVWAGGAPMQVMSSLTPMADGSALVIFGDRGVMAREAPRLWPELSLEFKAYATDFIALRVAP